MWLEPETRLPMFLVHWSFFFRHCWNWFVCCTFCLVVWLHFLNNLFCFPSVCMVFWFPFFCFVTCRARSLGLDFFSSPLFVPLPWPSANPDPGGSGGFIFFCFVLCIWCRTLQRIAYGSKSRIISSPQVYHSVSSQRQAATASRVWSYLPIQIKSDCETWNMLPTSFNSSNFQPKV